MKQILTGLSILLLIFSGCKKDNSSVNGKVKSYTFTSSSTGISTTQQRSYNAQGLLSENDSYNSNGILIGKQTISYSGNNIYFMYYDSAGTIPYILDTAITNAQGYIVTNSGGATFTYDGSGHRLTTNLNGNVGVNTWSSGNLTADSSGVNNVIRYTYTNKTDYRDFGQIYNGKGNSNLPNTVYLSNYAQTGTYSYTYDSQGRVSSVSVSYGTGNANAPAPYTTTITYTYLD